MAENRAAILANIPSANRVSLDSINVSDISNTDPSPTVIHGTLHPNYTTTNFKNPIIIGGTLVVLFFLLKK